MDDQNVQMERTMPFTDPISMLDHANGLDNTHFQKFVNLIGEHNNEAIYCFVEGYDQAYYQVRIESQTGKKTVFIDCKGKKNVIEIHDFLKSRSCYDSYKLLYIVDRDYDDNSTIESSGDYFITRGYSVENYYCSEDFIRKLAEIHCHLETQEEISKVLEDFRDRQNEFISATKDFCAWYKAAKERICDENSKSDFSKSLPTEYVLIKASKIERGCYDLALLNQRYPHEPLVSEDDFNNARLTINGTDDIRGKFVAQFIRSYIQRINFNSGKGLKLVPKSVQIQINADRFLQFLANCADNDYRLIEYVRSRCS